MCSNNLVLLLIFFVFPVDKRFCQSRVLPSSQKEQQYDEFGTTEDVDVGFTNDHSEGFDIYDVSNTVTKITTDEMDVDTNQPTSSMNVPLLTDVQNATTSLVNLTVTEKTELSDFLSEGDVENVTNNVKVTDEMEFVPLSTTDSLMQTETNLFEDVSWFEPNRFEDVSWNLESDLPTEIPLNFNFTDSLDYGESFNFDYGESFNFSTDATVSGISDVVMQERFPGNISVDSSSYEGTDGTKEVLTNFQNQSQDTVPVFGWSDVASSRNEEDGDDEEEEDGERKEEKSTNDIFRDGIHERGCGIPKSGHHSRKKRVVGGIRTVYGQLPWLVSLRFRGSHPFIEESGFNHLCGANLIHPRWLLSAAHCFNANVSDNDNITNASYWYAVLGENSLDDQESSQKVVEIEKIIVHELFSYTANIKHDIALLKLSETIEETDYQKFICLDPDNTIFPGEICTVAGWGMHSYEGNGSAYPFQTTLKVLSWSQCEEKIKDIDESARFIYSNSETTFCAYSNEGSDTCHGDSGGPFQCYRNGRWYLTGVTHAGYKCGEFPGVYIRVGHFIDWITDKMREN